MIRNRWMASRNFRGVGVPPMYVANYKHARDINVAWRLHMIVRPVDSKYEREGAKTRRKTRRRKTKAYFEFFASSFPRLCPRVRIEF
jgi:hypothetical protein